jgi:hypothetical protein
MARAKGTAQARKQPMAYYGNYQYSLTQEQQSDLQLFLRALPESAKNHPAWELLHALTYTSSWTEKPEFAVQPEFEVQSSR